MSARDLAGYRHGAPAIRWPGDARLAVSVVVNIEEGAELSIGDGDERNEAIYEAVERVEGERDPLYGEPLRLRPPRRLAAHPRRARAPRRARDR